MERCVCITLGNGFADWASGDYLAALCLFRHAIETTPESAEAWSGLGHALWSLGDFSGCLSSFLRACKIDPWYAAHWSNVGLAYRELGQGQRAVNCFRAAMLVDPCFEPALNEWANVLVDYGHFDEALLLYKRALSIDASRAVVHHNLGVCYLLLERRAEASIEFCAALGLDPNYEHSREELSRLSVEDGLNLH